MGFSTTAERRPLLTFLLLTFGIAWLAPGGAMLICALVDGLEVEFGMYSPLYFLSVWSPAVAALLIVAGTRGTKGLRAYLGRMLQWRFAWPWYALALVGIPIAYFLSSVLTWLAGASALTAPSGLWGAFLLSTLARGTAGPVEELGWRGFALPLLQRGRSGFRAALLLGAIWGLWHVPAFVVGTLYETQTQVPLVLALGRFFVQIMAFSVIITIAYNATRGSIPIAFLIHLAGNLAYPWEGDVETATAQASVLAVFAIILAATVGWRYLTRSNVFTRVLPEGSGVDDL